MLTYYLYRATLSEGFIYPVVTLFLLARDLTVAEVGLVNGVFFGAVVLAEIPTGYVGDRIGRRDSLVVSTLVITAAILGFTVAESLAGFVAVYAVWGVGLTLRSGSGSAWLYDTLDERLDTDEFARISGRGTAAFLVASGAMAVAGSYVYQFDRELPFFATAAVTASGALVLLTVPETDAYAEGETPTLTLADVRETVTERFAAPPLRAFIPFTAVLLAVPEFVDLYVQPISVAVGVPEARLGYLYAAFMLVTGVASYFVDRVRAAVGICGWFRVAPPLLGLGLAATGLLPVLAIPAFVLLRAVKNVSYAFRGQYLNDHLPSLGRATVLSTASMVYGLAFLLARVAGGALADAVGARESVAVVGLTLAVVASGWWLVAPPVAE